MTTPEAARMAEIVKATIPLMRQADFKKRRNTFNRVMASGLVHVVRFWQHPYEPSAFIEAPGFLERRYGTFRLDFGVLVPQMTRHPRPTPGAWVADYVCDLQTTIGALINENPHEDWWWPLSDPDAGAISFRALDEHGLPWLDRFPDQDAVEDQYRRYGWLDVGLSPAGPLEISSMLDNLGRHAEARAELERYVEEPHQGGHASYLAEYLPSIGHADLVARITIETEHRDED